MLLNQEIKMTWNSRNKRYYESKGYKYTKMYDEFYLSVYDLMPTSAFKVEVICDFCEETTYKEYRKYLQERENLKIDCCKNCHSEKSKTSNLIKYNVTNVAKLPHIQNKMKATSLKRYGVDNPMKNKRIQDISKQNCFEKYGVTNYSYTEEFKESMQGEGNPSWKGDEIKENNRQRWSFQYYKWRKSVWNRDDYACQVCNRRGNGIKLHAHHLESFSNNPNIRFDINNGITLCEQCHMPQYVFSFHNIYGTQDNTAKQFFEYLNRYDAGEFGDVVSQFENKP